MIYVLLTYFFYPFLYLLMLFKKSPSIPLFQRGTLKFPPLAKGGKGGFSGKSGKILVIQTAKIGDLICSTPVFREIKKKYPDIYLAVMANPAAKELLEHNPYVNEVITINNHEYKGFSGKIKLSNLIRKENYDIAICLNPNVPFAIALFWGLVPIRLSVMPDFSGVTFKLASIFYTFLEEHIRGRLVTETYMQMLKKIGIESSDISKNVYKSKGADKKANEIVIARSDSDEAIFKHEIPRCARNDKLRRLPVQINKPLIGIVVSSGNKLKEPGVEKIAGITNMLLDSFDAHVVFIGSKEDKETVNKVLVLVNKKNRIIDATGKFSLGELPALVEKLSLFIGVDTGITYMADALLIPIIDIAGPSDMSDQRPLGKNTRIIQKDISCAPCSHAFRAPYSCKRGDRICITSVSVLEIVEAAKKLLGMSYRSTKANENVIARDEVPKQSQK